MGLGYGKIDPRGVHAAAAEESQGTCGFPDTLRGGLTRSYSVQELSAAAGRVQTGEGARGPLPLAPIPKGPPFRRFAPAPLKGSL